MGYSSWAEQDILSWLRDHADGFVPFQIEEESMALDSGTVTERERYVADVVKNVIQHSVVRACGALEQADGRQSTFVQVVGRVSYLGGNRFIVQGEDSLIEFLSANLRRFSFDSDRGGWMLVLDLMIGASR